MFRECAWCGRTFDRSRGILYCSPKCEREARIYNEEAARVEAARRASLTQEERDREDAEKAEREARRAREQEERERARKEQARLEAERKQKAGVWGLRLNEKGVVAVVVMFICCGPLFWVPWLIPSFRSDK